MAYDGQTVEVKGLTLGNGAQRIDVAGTVGVDASASSALHVAMNQVQLADLEALHGRADLRVGGIMTGVADVSGTRTEPGVTAKFTVERGSYRELTFERLAGTLGYGQRRVTMNLQLDQQPGASLSAEGTVPLSLFASDAPAGEESSPIDLRVRSSTIGLDVVTGLTPLVRDVGGTAQVDLHVTGTADSPEFAGGMSVKDGRFFVVPAGRALLRPHERVPVRARRPRHRQPAPHRRWERSADGDRGAGPAAAGAWRDEAGDCRPELRHRAQRRTGPWTSTRC